MINERREMWTTNKNKEGFEEGFIWRFTWQLTTAIAHLHAHGITHRDIKAANILFLAAPGGRKSLRLCDFGVAHRIHPGELLEGSVGTPVYMAPEIDQNLPYDARVDVWSAGCLI